MLRRVPIVVILGSTGTGKTKLSIELAQRFGGEIISADSMQVYKGLDIATAKATTDEQAAAPHHLLDVASPTKPFTVVDFRNAALPIIDDLLAKQKIPIVVGGTNYYIESLLWQVLVNPPLTNAGDKRKADEAGASLEAGEIKRAAVEPAVITVDDIISKEALLVQNTSDEFFALMDSAKLHNLLKAVDPPMAVRLHPNNRRKVIRALEVFRDLQCRLSDLFEAQKNTPGGNRLGGPLRYEHVILFWLQCDQDVLNERLDGRINNMIVQGLLKEIREFYDSLEEFHTPNGTKDITKGILQTIGFKEFLPYLEQYDASQDARITEFMRHRNVNGQCSEMPEGVPLLQLCLEELRMTTKRYSKKQMKWVANRFLAETDRKVPDIYGLHSTHPLSWAQDVFGPAEEVIQSYIDGKPCGQVPMGRYSSLRAGLSENVAHVCDVCNRHFVGEFQWGIHLKSNKHKRVAARRRKEAERQGGESEEGRPESSEGIATS